LSCATASARRASSLQRSAIAWSRTWSVRRAPSAASSGWLRKCSGTSRGSTPAMASTRARDQHPPSAPVLAAARSALPTNRRDDRSRTSADPDRERNTVDELMNAIIDAHDEAVRARAKWSTLNSPHEGYGVLAEKFRKLERHVFIKQGDRDLAAMRTE